MTTAFQFIQVTPAIQKVVGKPDKATRIHRRKGSYEESGQWFDDLQALTEDRFVSPGGVSMYVPVSRAAVHKRLKEGRLTAFCFHVTQKEKTFFGTEREAKSRPYIYIPVSECKAWAKELEARFPTDDDAEKHRDDEFLAKDPADRGNRRVKYSNNLPD